MIEINPDALTEAKASDALRKRKKAKGVFAGIPIIVKDNYATERLTPGSMNTTAGSFALLGSVPSGDSTAVAKLRAQGAIILGKANLPQWANYRSTNSTNGWSARGNQTYGAYFSRQDPSGSSSGSAVAASIGLSFATFGSETSGSLISPGQRNNLAVIKPSVGLTSRFNVIPISEHQDTAGPMTRTVKDAAAILSVIAGKDPKDPYTAAIPFRKIPDYVAACKNQRFERQTYRCTFRFHSGTNDCQQPP